MPDLFSSMRPNANTPESGLSTDEKLAWLRLSRTENVGPVTFYRLLESCGTAEKALEMLPEFSRRGGRKKPLTAPPASDAERELKALQKRGGEIICACEPAYPLALGATEDAPPVLSVIGDTALMQHSCIGMVGARNASLNGRKFAEKLARDLGRAEQVVVSGLARGIDTAAHTGSLETGAIAVVAGGIDVIYPEENRGLYEQIADKGLIVAESPLGRQPIAQSFPRRNRIVSGLSLGVVVVEATLRSGSLITARLAGEQGRDVYAVPGFPGDPRAQGPNSLIRDGATLIQSAQDILDHLDNFTGRSFEEPQERNYSPDPYLESVANDAGTLEEARTLLLENLSHTPVSVDELIRSCQFSIPMLQTVLLEFELGGKVRRHPGNRVSLLN